MILHLLKYNNYFTRQIKGFDNWSDYEEYQTDKQNAFNFNPADGISTTAIVNTSNSDIDYAIVTDDDESTIVSRWFIMEANRTRGKQYQLTLRRDVVYDNLEAVEEAPCFIEKADIRDADDPLLLNSENMTYNQIKSDEYMLKDPSQLPWIVLYLAKNADAITGTIDTNPDKLGDVITLTSTIKSWEYWDYVENDFIGPISDLKAIICSVSTNVWYKDHYYFNSFIDKDGKVKTDRCYYLTKGYNDSCYSIVTEMYTGKEVNAALQSGLDGYGTDYLPGIERLKTVINNELVKGHDQVDIDKLMAYNGKIICDSNNDYYYCTVSNNGVTSMTDETDVLTATMPLTTAALTTIAAGITTAGAPTDGTFKLAYQSTKYRVSLTPVPDVDAGFTIPQTLNGTDDALYNVLALPYGNIPVIDQDGNTVCQTSETIALAIASAISRAGASNIYDIQLLPYCPVQNAIQDGRLHVDTTLENKTYITVKDEDNDIYGVIINVPKATFKFTINKKLDIPRTYTKTAAKAAPVSTNLTSVYHVITSDSTKVTGYIDMPNVSGSGTYSFADYDPFYSLITTKVGNYSNVNYSTTFDNKTRRAYITITPKSGSIETYGHMGSALPVTVSMSFTLAYKAFTTDYAEDKKVCNECDLYRLVSPNYSGQFEFSLAKNDGVSWFDVDCTYRPYNPYIHVNPAFKSLYGAEDYHDVRGLVCGGDFSFGQLTDQWAEYELNNKNLLDIFDREIKHMDINNRIQMGQTITGAVLGTASGVAGGAMAGTMAGGRGAAGAVIGGTTSAVAGIADIGLTYAQQQENRSYVSDKFGFQLGNVQALPYSLAKVSALTANNKLFPFLEYYTCTKREKAALRQKLKYDGMTVMAIGYINDYVSDEESFVRGQIIRISVDDTHMSNEIYNEIAKGVYL